MLRTAMLNEIRKSISSDKYFEEDDFLITSTKNNNNNYVLQVQYRFDPKFKFIAWIPDHETKKDEYGSMEFKITTQESPGQMGETERYTYSGKSELLSGISSWVGVVQQELLAIPIYRQAAEQREQLEEILSQFESVGDTYFSQEEAQEMKKRLEELEQRIAENLKNTVTDQTELKTKLQNLESDMNALKEKLASHKKRGWAGAVAVRVLEWAKDPINRKVLTSGAEITKDLLLKAGEHITNNK
jgi:hypothetical protein